MKKIFLLSTITIMFLNAEVIIEDLSKEDKIEKKVPEKKEIPEKKETPEKNKKPYVVNKEKAIKDLKEYVKKGQFNKKFEYGYFYGHLVKDNPELIDEIENIFKKAKNTDVFTIIKKYAKIKKRYFYSITNYNIVDPLKYNKPSRTVEDMLVGEYRYTRDKKYLDKLYIFSKESNFAKYKLFKLSREIKEVKDYLKEKEPKIEKKKKVEKKEEPAIPKGEIIKSEKKEKK